MSPASDPYKILGLNATATEAEIKRAYRKLARQWHPDQFQDPSEKQKAEAEIKRINIAYSQLKDPSFQPESRSGSSSSNGASQASGGATVQKGSSAQRQARAQSYYRQAHTLEQAERYQEATKALTLAINLIPDYAEAYQYRAYLYDLRGFEFLAAKDQKKAKTLGLERAYRSAPQDASAQSPSPKVDRPPSRSPSAPSPSHSTQSPKATRSASSTGVFSCPQPMAAVNQTWDCTARLNSPNGNVSSGKAGSASSKTAGAITQLLPYGSTNGISASASGLIQLWNFERGYDFADLQGHSDQVLDLSLSKDGTLLTSASQDGTVKLWHLATASLTRSFPTGVMTSITFGPEPHAISCCSEAGKIFRWSSTQETSQPKFSTALWAKRAAATYAKLTADHKVFVIRNPDQMLVRHLTNPGEPSRIFPHSQFEQTCIALGPSGGDLAAGDRTGLIRLWNLQTAEPILAIQGRAGVVEAIAFTPDNRLMASLCRIAPSATADDKTLVQIWSCSSREQLCDIPGPADHHRFTSLCFSGDSKRLVIGTATGELQIWQPAARA